MALPFVSYESCDIPISLVTYSLNAFVSDSHHQEGLLHKQTPLIDKTVYGKFHPSITGVGKK
jgi:hypothetical protein